MAETIAIMAEPKQTGLAQLPSIGLVDKHGSAYRVTDPDALPEAWSWAVPALQKLQEELAPTGNKAIDALKNKLVRVFSQSGGLVVVTEGQERMNAFYPFVESDRLSDPAGLTSIFRKSAAWLVDKAFKNNPCEVASFTALYWNSSRPAFRIAFQASSYVDEPNVMRTNMEADATGIVHENIMFRAPLLHELTHAAVEVGNLLSGRETKSPTSNKDSRNRIVNTPMFRLLRSLESSLFNSIPRVVDTCPYEEKQKLEETLTFAVENFCGGGGRTSSPLLDRFIAGIF